MSTTSLVARVTSHMRLLRAALMANVMLALVVAGWAGLVRIGWSLPTTLVSMLLAHGPLMVCGVLATLVGLERAGAVSLILGLPISLSASLLTGGSAVLMTVCAVIVRVQPAAFTRAMALGAVLLFTGNGLWLVGLPVFRVVPWWMGFLVFTIAGERLELGRLRRLPPIALRAFAGASAILTTGVVLSALHPDLGARVLGLGLLGLGLWLLRYDIARRTLHNHGLPQYVAVCLLSGHVWLAAGGALAVITGFASSGLFYDAMLYMIFVGFVFSMIFGHAPNILPAVMGIAIAPLKQFYAPLVLLHLSLAMRVMGDLSAVLDLRRWGGMLNGVALLLFIGLMAYAAHIAVRHTHAALHRKETGHEKLTPA